MARLKHKEDQLRQRWWRVKDDDRCADALWGWIDRLKLRSRAENLIDLIHEAIYEGRPLGTTTEYPALQDMRRQKSAPANLNITRSMVDTGTAKLCKRRPMPVISADDAGWSEKLHGKRASRVLRRKMGKPDVERMGPDIVRDMMIRGTGVGKVVRDGGDVTVERVPRHELVVDPREGRYGWPAVRTMAQVKRISRDELIEQFPEYEDEIEQAASQSANEWDPSDYDVVGSPDQIEVAEGWHLPSEPGAKDGLHVIVLRGGCVLLRELWRRPRFPFAFSYWSSPVRGVWGHGLVEDLVGIQAKVNDIARDIQECLYHGASLKIFLPRGSNVVKSHLRARHPVVIEFDGTKPEYVAPLPVSPQMFQFLQWLIDKAYEISGISQLSASSKNPLGSNASGKAIDTMYDIESDRFAQVELSYAMFRTDLGMLMIDEAKAMAEEAGSKGSDLKRSDLAPWITEIDWRKVKIDEGEYHLSIEPQNFLPDTRGGKLAAINEMAKAGLLTNPTVIASLFDEPDLTRAMRTRLAPYNNLLRVAEGLADDSIPMLDLQPDVHMDLASGIEMMKAEYNDAQACVPPAPERILERYRSWIDLAKFLKDKGEATVANANMAAPGVGAGAPLGTQPPRPFPLPGSEPLPVAPAPGMIAA